MHELFPYALDGWASWSRVFCSPECFTPLARCLFEREHLPFTALEPCRPGTNAVFRSGAYIVKIYAPAEAGVDFRTDFETELSGLRNAAQNGIPVPEVVAAEPLKTAGSSATSSCAGSRAFRSEISATRSASGKNGMRRAKSARSSIGSTPGRRRRENRRY